MKTSIDILDAIAAAHGGCSDYRISKLTGSWIALRASAAYGFNEAAA